MANGSRNAGSGLSHGIGRRPGPTACLGGHVFLAVSYVTARNLAELLERVRDMLLPNALDRIV